MSSYDPKKMPLIVWRVCDVDDFDRDAQFARIVLYSKFECLVLCSRRQEQTQDPEAGSRRGVTVYASLKWRQRPRFNESIGKDQLHTSVETSDKRSGQL